MNILVDVHAHLDHPMIGKDLPEMMKRAKEAGIYRVITNGIDKVTNRKTLELAKEYDIVEAALGIYPPDALRSEIDNAVESGFFTNEDKIASSFDISEELEFIRAHLKEIVAIGEIGLDFKSGEDRKEQEEVFREQVEMGIKAKIPVIIHSRKAEREVMEIMEGYGYKKVVLHCFSGKKSLIKRGIEAGLSFSVPTNVVKAEHFQHLIDMVPIPKLLTETDAPYLSPYQDKVNEPSFVVESVKKIAEIKGLTLEEAKGIIFQNYRNMFE